MVHKCFRSSSLNTLGRNMWFSFSTHWTSHLFVPQVCLTLTKSKNWSLDISWCYSFPFFSLTSPLFAEITAFSDRHAEFEQLNTEILGVSVDSVVSCFLHLSWTLLKLVASKTLFFFPCLMSVFEFDRLVYIVYISVQQKLLYGVVC